MFCHVTQLHNLFGMFRTGYILPSPFISNRDSDCPSGYVTFAFPYEGIVTVTKHFEVYIEVPSHYFTHSGYMRFSRTIETQYTKRISRHQVKEAYCFTPIPLNECIIHIHKFAYESCMEYLTGIECDNEVDIKFNAVKFFDDFHNGLFSGDDEMEIERQLWAGEPLLSDIISFLNFVKELDVINDNDIEFLVDPCS